MRKGRVVRALKIVPPSPKTEEVQPVPDQIVQKAKTETTARGINRALAPALTATEPMTVS